MNEKIRKKIMVFAAILALLIVSASFSGQPVRAQTMTVNLSQNIGPIGIQVEVNGTLENVGAQFKVFWDYIKDWDGRSGFLAEGYAEGYNYKAILTVPPAGAGEHYVIVEDEKSHATAYAVFTVTPEITVEPSEGPAGISAVVSGVLASNVTITTDFYDPASGDEMDVAQAQTDENGSYTAGFTIPQVLAGDYKVRAYWKGTLQAEAQFTVRYEIAAEPYRAPVGAKVKVSGRAAANESFTLALSNATLSIGVAEVQTDIEGFFEEHIVVPEASVGKYTIMAYNGWLQVEAPFEITPPPSISLDPVEGFPGDEVTVSGSHYAPNSNVTIYFYTEPMEVTTSNTNETGDFTAVFNVPEAAAGTHMVEAVDSIYGVSTMTPFRVHSVVIKPRSTEYIQGDAVSFYVNSTAEFEAGSIITIEITDPVGCPFIALRIDVTDLVKVGGVWTAPYDVATGLPAIPSDAQVGTWAWNATYYSALYPGEEKRVSGMFNVAERLTIDKALDRLDELEVKVKGVLGKADEIYLLIQASNGELLAKLGDINARLAGLITTAKGDVLAEVNTAVGTMELRLGELNAAIKDVKDSIAAIQTSLRTAEANVLEAKNAAAEAREAAAEAESATAGLTTTLNVTVILSLVAAIVSIADLIQLRKQTAS